MGLSKLKPLCCFLLAALVGCGSPREEAVEETATVQPDWPYEYVSTKSERIGSYNVSDTFAYSGNIDIANLKAFCRDRYSQTDAEGFYYVVIFDTAENAGFPSYPLTAGYALDEDLATHIRATCEFNKTNGFAELHHYADNSYESIASVEPL